MVQPVIRQINYGRCAFIHQQTPSAIFSAEIPIGDTAPAKPFTDLCIVYSADLPGYIFAVEVVNDLHHGEQHGVRI